SVYQKHLGIIDLPRLNEFTRQTGVDPRKDLTQVLSMSNGKTGLFMAQGKFNAGDLEARLQKQGAKQFEYKGYRLYGDERSAVMFINAGTALAGSTASLKSVVDERQQRRRGLPPALSNRVRSIAAGTQIWVAFIGGVQ